MLSYANYNLRLAELGQDEFGSWILQIVELNVMHVSTYLLTI